MNLIPYVVEDTGRGERSMDIFSRLLMDRIVLIGTAIDDRVANNVIAQLLFLATDDPDQEIKIYINSPGGDVSAGLAVYDTMMYLSSSCCISTMCVGNACSIAALLLASGTKGHRSSLPHSRIMIHQPFGAVYGRASEIELQAEEMLRIKGYVHDILAKLTGKTKEEIEVDIDKERSLSPTDAINYGLIDVKCANKS